MKVLLVDDDKVLASSVAKGLSYEGITVDVAANGDDGWWMATEASYDVIVLDIMLPKRNGFVLCRDLRAAGDWTPIVMLTAKSGEHDQIEALELGADDYVTKPFSFSLLLARMRAAVRRAQQRRAVATTAGALRIDAGARQVWLHDVEIELTTREFDVLEFLLRAGDQVTSKEAILDGVWSYDFDGDPNIVEVYIGRLRRKLRQASGDELITTVRGAGYRLGQDDA